MTATERKERDRRRRHELIVRAARDLAEAEGWDAVTTRRLADRVEYSQPVLYSHFENKDAIMRAVALEGFADLAVQLRAARLAAPSPDAAVRALAQSYLDFAAAHPALYEAMFSLPLDVRFASPGHTPQPLQDGFAQFVAVLARPAPGAAEQAFGDPVTGALAEVLWAALHGLVTLTRQGRLPPEAQPARLDLLLARLTGTVTGEPEIRPQPLLKSLDDYKLGECPTPTLLTAAPGPRSWPFPPGAGSA